MDSDKSKSKEPAENCGVRKFPDHPPPVMNEEGFVIDCVLKDYQDPPKGTVETRLNGHLVVDYVDVHERSLQIGYQVPNEKPRIPKVGRPVPEGAIPVLRRSKGYNKPWSPTLPPKQPIPPYGAIPCATYSPLDAPVDSPVNSVRIVPKYGRSTGSTALGGQRN